MKLLRFQKLCWTTPCRRSFATRNGEAYPKQLSAEIFKQAVPKLDKKKLRFWLLLHEEAFQHLKASGFKQLPQQRCSGTNNANLGNFQASSSFSKQVAFYAWIVNRHEKLSGQAAYMVSLDLEPESFVWSASFLKLNKTVSLDYRASDTQLCFWGKLDPRKASQALRSLELKWAAWCGSFQASQSFRSTFTAQQASTGELQAVSGSLPRIGAQTACSMQRSTGSFRRT